MGKLTPGITDLPTLTRELNVLLERIDEQLRLTPRLTRDGDLDLKGRRITRVGQTKQRDDVPSRLELERKGLYETPSGQHVANSDIIVTGGIRSTRRAKEPDELVPLRQVKQMLGASSNALVTDNLDQTALGFKSFAGIGTPVNSVSCVNGVNNNLSFGSTGIAGSFIYITGPTAAFSISGLRRNLGNPGGYNGQIVILFNATGFAMTLLYATNGTGSTDANRFWLANNSNVVVGAKGSVMFTYVELVSKWVNVSRV